MSNKLNLRTEKEHDAWNAAARLVEPGSGVTRVLPHAAWFTLINQSQRTAAPTELTAGYGRYWPNHELRTPNPRAASTRSRCEEGHA